MKWIIIIVIALLVLSYYGYDVRKVVESPTTRNNFAYAGEMVSDVWKDYIKPSASFLWNKISSAVDNK
ncbi:MAG: hypothetical protein Q8Q03_00935 [bacterium]|nr:hypothetical protein [bacterium]